MVLSAEAAKIEENKVHSTRSQVIEKEEWETIAKRMLASSGGRKVRTRESETLANDEI